MPVAAVGPAGRPSVSSGSTKTRVASNRGEKMIFLTCVSSTEITVLRPTSLPVPAVVGTAISAGTRSLMASAPPSMVAYRASGPSCVAAMAWPRPGLFVLVVEQVAGMMNHQRDGLGDVNRGAAAYRDDGIGVMSAVGVDARRHLRFHRIAPNAGEHGSVNTAITQNFHRARDRPQRRQALVGHDQGSCASHLFQRPRNQPERARTVLNPGRKVVLPERHGYSCL